MAGHHCRDRRQVGDDVNTLWRRLDKTLNPKPLNPKPKTPKPLNPKSAEKEAWGRLVERALVESVEAMEAKP